MASDRERLRRSAALDVDTALECVSQSMRAGDTGAALEAMLHHVPAERLHASLLHRLRMKLRRRTQGQLVSHIPPYSGCDGSSPISRLCVAELFRSQNEERWRRENQRQNYNAATSSRLYPRHPRSGMVNHPEYDNASGQWRSPFAAYSRVEPGQWSAAIYGIDPAPRNDAEAQARVRREIVDASERLHRDPFGSEK